MIDKIDLTGVLQEAGIKSLNFVDKFGTKVGDAVLGHDSKTGRSTLAVDTTGNGTADLMIASQSQIKQTDVIWNGEAPTVTPTPGPTVVPVSEPVPSPVPSPISEPTDSKPDPKPDPDPQPEPRPSPGPAPRSGRRFIQKVF